MIFLGGENHAGEDVLGNDKTSPAAFAHCRACGIHLSEHDGVSVTCYQLQEANAYNALLIQERALLVAQRDTAMRQAKQAISLLQHINSMAHGTSR
jgi:hypothetical protein